MKNTRLLIKISCALCFALAAILVLSLIIKNHAQAQKSQDTKIKEKTIEDNDFGSYTLDYDQQTPLKYEEKNELKIDDNKKLKTYISKIYHANFPFIAIGPILSGTWPKNSDLNLELRILEDKGWSQWYVVNFDDMAGPEQESHTANEYFGSQVFTKLGTAWQYRLILLDRDSQKKLNIKSLKFNYIDTRNAVPPQKTNKQEKKSSGYIKNAFAQVNTANGPGIVSRAGWGSPQAGYSPAWPPSYATVNRMIIHHTVGTPVGAAAVLAIWNYHTYTRGWGDIGYNYLVDANGTIFEGRYGGNAVIGAHASNANVGSIGVAAMGTYSSGVVPAPLYNSMTDLLAWKMYKNDLGLNIVGHRDVGSTSCPGDGLYAQQPSIRATAKQKAENYLYLAYSSGNPRVYLVDKIRNKKIWVPNPTAFNNLSMFTLNLYAKTPEFMNGISGFPPVYGLGPNVYLIDGDQKRHITSWETLLSLGYTANDLVYVSDYILAQFPTGAPISNFVKSSTSNIYLLDGGKKYMFESSAIFSEWGYQLNQVMEVNQEYLNKITDGGNIGLIVYSSGHPEVYLILGGQRRYISADIYQAWGITSGQLTQVPYSMLSSKPQGKNLDNMAYIKGDTKVYLMDLGQKSHIPDAVVFAAWNFKWDKIVGVPSGLLNNIPEVAWIGQVVKGVGGGSTYLVDKGEKKLISDSVFTDWGLRQDQVREISAHLLGGLKTGKNLTSLINDESGKVYILYNGQRSWVADYQALVSWNFFDKREIIPVSSFITSAISTNSTVPKLTYLIAIGDAPEVYLLDYGNKRWIPSLDILYAWAGPTGLNRLVTVPADFVQKYNIGSGAAVGRIVYDKLHPQVWFIENGTKRWINDYGNYLNYTFFYGALIEVSDQTLKFMPQGSVVPPLPIQAKILATGGFRVYSGGVQIASGGANGTVGVNYNPANNQYMMAAPGVIKITNAPIRVTADPGIGLVLLNYYDPNWNKTANYNMFRNTIEIVYSSSSKPPTLWAVNELPIEDYLRGMAEASSQAHIEHLKTMSVAERAYAYYHLAHPGKHGSEPFNLKNSRQGNGNDQVYAGYAYELAAQKIGQASSATAGQVVTYGGQPIITPYSSGTDGRTRSALERWGIDYWPWCISVPDPDCINNSSCNPTASHMVGLSAYGALKKAERGESYPAILAYYYRGTGIGLIGNPLLRVSIYAAARF